MMSAGWKHVAEKIVRSFRGTMIDSDATVARIAATVAAALRQAAAEHKPPLIDDVKCWRCGGQDSSSGRAILYIEFGDESYSGMFRVPLCDRCLLLPHGASDLERI